MKYKWGTLPAFFYTGLSDALYDLLYAGADFHALDKPGAQAASQGLDEIDQGVDWITAEPRMPDIRITIPAPETGLLFSWAEMAKRLQAGVSANSKAVPDFGHRSKDEVVEAAHGVVNLDRVILNGDWEQLDQTVVRPIIAYSRHQRDDRYGTQHTAIGQKTSESLEVVIRAGDWGEETRDDGRLASVIRGGVLHAGVSFGIDFLFVSSMLLDFGYLGRIRKQIRGTNPAKSAVRERIRATAAQSGIGELHQNLLIILAHQESGFRQFFDNESARDRTDAARYNTNVCGGSDPFGAVGLPLFGPSNKTAYTYDAHGGYGIFQLDKIGSVATPEPSAWTLWDWTANIDRALMLYKAKVFGHGGSLDRLRALYAQAKAQGARPFRVDEVIRECAVGWNGIQHGDPNRGYYTYWDTTNNTWQPGRIENAFYANRAWNDYYEVFEKGILPADWD